MINMHGHMQYTKLTLAYFCMLFILQLACTAGRINNIVKWANFSNNGASEME